MNETQAPQQMEEVVKVEAEEPEMELNLLSDGARFAGLTLMSITVLMSVCLAAWVVWNRTAPVVKMMQPIFLLLLCIGTVITSFAIIPLGANDENTANVDAACFAWPWLSYIGSTVTLSALFSKLWRVNQIFHAQGFQRKVVTVQDVLRPFVGLLGINLTFLILMAVFARPVWKREPIDESDPFNTLGYCSFENDWGFVLEALLALVVFVALVILCVQAYRARDIKSEFSEARGVALALFTWLQSILIVTPTDAVLKPEDVDARYTLTVTQNFVNSLALLCFIFVPIIAHHRQRRRRRRSTGGTTSGGTTTRTRISGLEYGSSRNMVPPRTVSRGSTSRQDDEQQRHPALVNAEHPNVPEMVLELQALRARVAELEGDISMPEKGDGNETGVPSEEETEQPKEGEGICVPNA